MRASTPKGVLQGALEGGIHVYRGIPYARAPVGALRFRAPETAEPWTGVRDARRPGPAAPQRSALARRRTRWSAVPAAGVSEDCLYLNVHSPASAGGHRPVLFWIHGGGYSHGSGSWYLYGGHRLARRGDAVVVTINYRLGALGNLYLRGFGDTQAGTNAGLRDQLMALTWVRENIEAFGGDPENVTVFGQSAGAMSIGALLTAPAARGLFRRAILQSGAMHNVLTPERAHAVAGALLESLGIDPQKGDVLRALRGRSADEILRAQLQVSARHRLPLGMLTWQPVADDDLLPGLPFEADPPSDIPLLIGTNRDEWKMFTATDAKRRKLDAETLRGYVERTLARNGMETTDGVEDVLDHYAHDIETGELRTPADAWVALQTDRVFRLPAVDLADRHVAAGGRAFVYRFDWSPQIARRRVGACHAMEIPFVFGTLRQPLVRALIGLRPSSLRLSDAMLESWLAFARGGDPRHEALPDWPLYESGQGDALVFCSGVVRGRASGAAGIPATRPALGFGTRALWRQLGSGS